MDEKTLNSVLIQVCAYLMYFKDCFSSSFKEIHNLYILNLTDSASYTLQVKSTLLI